MRLLYSLSFVFIAIWSSAQENFCEIRYRASLDSSYIEYTPQDSIDPRKGDTITVFAAGYGFEYIRNIDERYNYSVLKGLKSLEYLDVGNLDGDPSVLCDLKQLRSLDITDEDFCFPSCMQPLVNLQELFFKLDESCSFPNFVYQCREICHLGFEIHSKNHLPDIDSLSQLKKLQHLDILITGFENRYANMLLNQLYHISSLKKLTLNIKDTDKMPIGIRNVHQIEVLATSCDILSKENIEFISSMKSLKKLEGVTAIKPNDIDDSVLKLKNLQSLTLYVWNRKDAQLIETKLQSYLKNTIVEIR